MKRIRILRGKVGLVFRKGDYHRVITEGAYWISPFERVFQYDRAKPFTPSMELSLLLTDEKLAEKFPKINWIVGSHTQSFLRYPKKKELTSS